MGIKKERKETCINELKQKAIFCIKVTSLLEFSQQDTYSMSTLPYRTQGCFCTPYSISYLVDTHAVDTSL